MKIKSCDLFKLLKVYDISYYTSNYSICDIVSLYMSNSRESKKILNHVYNIRQLNRIDMLEVDNDIELLCLYTFLYLNGK